MKNNFEDKELFQIFFEISQEGIVITDISDTILDINPAFEKISGYLKKDCVGLSIFDFVPEKLHQVLKKRRGLLSRNIPVDLGEFEFIDKSGMIKTVESNSITIPYKNDNAILSIIRDITEKKMIGQQFLREKQFSENLLKSLPGIFFVVEILQKFALRIYKKKEIKKDCLTNKEKEILIFICKGLSSKEISDKTNISPKTVEVHRARLLKKTDCKNTAQLKKC